MSGSFIETCLAILNILSQIQVTFILLECIDKCLALIKTKGLEYDLSPSCNLYMEMRRKRIHTNGQQQQEGIFFFR